MFSDLVATEKLHHSFLLLWCSSLVCIFLWVVFFVHPFFFQTFVLDLFAGILMCESCVGGGSCTPICREGLEL